MFELLSKTIRAHFRYLLFLILTLGSYFSIVFWKILDFKPDGLYAGHVNVWSDWSLHISIANTFAFKSLQDWFAYHPLYAGGKFTYPFLTNLISGMLMKLGMPLKHAFVLPSIFLTFSLLVGLYLLFYLLVKSKKLSVLSVFIFFLSAGTGFVNFLKELWRNPSFEFLKYPPIDYGRYDIYQWFAGNMAVGLLIPQRSFLIGVTLGVWAIVGVLYVILRDNLAESIKTKILVISGILAGVLPIAHPHSFMAVFLITGLICLFSFSKWRILWHFVLIAGIISSVLYLTFIWGGIENNSFVKWNPGYTVKGDFFDWVKMWSLLWGIMLPMAILGLYFWRNSINYSGWAVYISAFMIFTVGNLYLLQPIAWDNSKIFWWSYLILSAPVSMALASIWAKRNFIFRVMAILLFLILTLTGITELTRLVQVDKHDFMMTSTDDINLGLEIREKTDSLAVFLTAPSHNHFVMVWGLRPILMGYTAWAWNFGFNYSSREADMREMYLGVDVSELLKKYNISYVVIGPTEINDLNANEKYFSEHFPLIFRNDNYRIYDTRQFN
ncbi:MAG: hypothetical protein HYT62_03700 [Candidatus Yanofskybacteria bacterium]|nr:hypothetical protein [Candidatus Yanofskybacteria bacterium]